MLMCVCVCVCLGGVDLGRPVRAREGRSNGSKERGELWGECLYNCQFSAHMRQLCGECFQGVMRFSTENYICSIQKYYSCFLPGRNPHT